MNIEAHLRRHGSSRFGHVREGRIVETATFADLASSALDSRERLMAAGIIPGTPVMLSVKHPLMWVRSFVQLLSAGAIPVPLPDIAGARPLAALTRIQSIAVHSQARALVTEAGMVNGISTALPDYCTIVDPALNVLRCGKGQGMAPRAPRGVSIIQYSSGSVSEPKACHLSMKNLLTNAHQAEQVYGLGSSDRVMNWVPLFHDMGLMTSVIWPLLLGSSSYIMDRFEFIAHPLNWINSISTVQATFVSAPGFAYGAAARRPGHDRTSHRDLSELQTARVAGEPIDQMDLQAFTARFAREGFRERAFCPSYGMAEATLLVTSRRSGQEIEIAKHVTDHPVVNCGAPVSGTIVRVLGPKGRRLPHGEVGEIAVGGPQLVRRASGAGLTRSRGLHRTGDLGFMVEGCVYPIGRKDDFISVLGTNVWFRDVEHIVGRAHPDIRRGRVAAISVGSLRKPSLCVLAETRAGSPPELIEQGIIQSIVEHGLPRPEAVILVPAGTIPVTTSGKLRRSECTAIARRLGRRQ